MPPATGAIAGAAHDQRDVGGLVERVAPLLLQAAVRAEQVAVVGGEHDDRVVGHARRLERVEDPADRLVDDLVQVVVEPAVGQIGGLVGEHLRPHLLELLLARGPPGERVAPATAPRGCRARCRRLARSRAAARRGHRRTRCRAGSRTTRPRATARRSEACARSPNSSTTCSANTPSRTVPQSDFAAPWGSRPIHPEKPNGFKPIRLAVRLDRVGDGTTVVVGRHHTFVAARDREIRRG